jgi:hypothetical protein
MRMLSALILAGVFAVTGCEGDAETMDEPPMDGGMTVMVTTSPAQMMCLQACLDMYRSCVKPEGDVRGCMADREECKEACAPRTCMPGGRDCP